MLEIVCEAGSVRRVVFAAGAHGNFSVEAWLFMVLGEINLEAIVQFEYRCLERVIGIARIDAGVACRGRGFLRAHIAPFGRLAAGSKKQRHCRGS